MRYYSKVLYDKVLIEFATKVLKLPKRKYKEIVVDYFNNPIGILYNKSGDKLLFLDDDQKELVKSYISKSARERKKFLLDYERNKG